MEGGRKQEVVVKDLGRRTSAFSINEIEKHYEGFLRILMRKMTITHSKGSLGTQMKKKRQNEEATDSSDGRLVGLSPGSK